MSETIEGINRQVKGDGGHIMDDTPTNRELAAYYIAEFAVIEPVSKEAVELWIAESGTMVVGYPSFIEGCKLAQAEE